MSNTNWRKGPRTVALVGLWHGKIQNAAGRAFSHHRRGAAQRVRRAEQHRSHTSPEARARQMSVEINCATAAYLEREFHLPRLPRFDRIPAGCAVCDPGRGCGHRRYRPEPAKVQMLKPYLKRLADLKIPISCSSTRSTRRTARCARFSRRCRKQRHAALVGARYPSGKRRVVTVCRSGARARFAYREQRPPNPSTSPDREREKEARFAMLENSPITTSI